MAQESQVTEEIASCHVQLMNNVAVVVVCCYGPDAAISILRKGLQQYPDCLAIKFNLVLLLWRKNDKGTAVTLWMKARGLDPEAKIRERGASDGEGGVSAQQLVYLDALVLDYWCKLQSSQLADSSTQYVEYIESLSTAKLRQN
eukprot:jgi/Phyca11/114401/e_gw1.26.459.1